MKRTNIVIDEELIEAARKATGLRTQREVVDFALRELVRRQNIKKLAELRGQVEWDGNLDDLRRDRAL